MFFINEPDQLAALHDRLTGRMVDMLFVNAGITNPNGTDTTGTVSTDMFVQVMLTNTLSPMRVIDRLETFVSPTGLIGVMSSGWGSVSNNVNGEEELYRGSKAGLNSHAGSLRALILMAPGWVHTAMGGPNARLDIEESVPNLVNVLLEKQGKPGLEYLDYLGRTVPW